MSAKTVCDLASQLSFREPSPPASLVDDRAAGPYRGELRILWIDWPDTREFVAALAEFITDALIIESNRIPDHGRRLRTKGCDSLFDVIVLSGLSAFDRAHLSGDQARLRAFIGTVLSEAGRYLAHVAVRTERARWTAYGEEPLSAFLERAERPIEIVPFSDARSVSLGSKLAHLVPARLKDVIAR